MTLLTAFVSLFLIGAPVTAAEDLTGKWSGSFTIIGEDGSPNDERIFMDLKQAGAELSGTAGPSAEKQWAIAKGKVDGASVSFQVQSDGPLISFALTLSEGRLKGDASAEQDGRKLSAKVDAGREK